MRVPWLLLVAACTFDPDVGAASSGPVSVGEGESSTSSSSVTSLDPPGGSTSDQPGGSSESSSEAGSSGEAASADSGGLDCSDGVAIVVAVEQSDLEEPMSFADAPDPIGTYAYSEQADAGTVLLEVDVPCDGDYAMWGLVYDEDSRPFDNGGNADSFYVRVDNEQLTVEWSYGCTTVYQVDTWSYERVQAAAVQDCATPERMVYALTAGKHRIAIANIESGQHGDGDPGSVAAIARVVLTNIEGYTPDPDLD